MMHCEKIRRIDGKPCPFGIKWRLDFEDGTTLFVCDNHFRNRPPVKRTKNVTHLLERVAHVHR